jgi:benzil reductase ((S)-benzoin forming)
LIKNKTFLITGHTSGLGYSLNKILLKNNNKIIGISRSKSEINNLLNLKVNFLDLKKLKTKLEKIKKIKKIDFVVLNAGLLGELDKFENIDSTEFEKIMKVNFFSNKIIVDFILSNKIKVKNIVAISSGAALDSKFGWGSYCISKAAMKMMIDTYALENKKINFVNLAPGIIKTKMQKKIFNTKKNFNSLKKFKDLYKKNLIDSPDTVALKMLNYLSKIKKFNSKNYIDLRNE